jgi:hypothetical protein
VGIVSVVRCPHSGQVMVDCKIGWRAVVVQSGCADVQQSRERAQKRFQTVAASRPPKPE